MTARLWLQYAAHLLTNAFWKIVWRVERIGWTRQDRQNEIGRHRVPEFECYPYPTHEIYRRAHAVGEDD